MYTSCLLVRHWHQCWRTFPKSHVLDSSLTVFRAVRFFSQVRQKLGTRAKWAVVKFFVILTLCSGSDRLREAFFLGELGNVLPSHSIVRGCDQEWVNNPSDYCDTMHLKTSMLWIHVLFHRASNCAWWICVLHPDIRKLQELTNVLSIFASMSEYIRCNSWNLVFVVAAVEYKWH